MIRRLISVAFVGLLMLTTATPALASWPSTIVGGANECNGTESGHCYALSEHHVNAIASIAFIKDLNANVSEWAKGARSSHEQWISFGKENEWIETGDVTGYPYNCCSPHPYYAEQKSGTYKEELSTGVVPGGAYNHYILYDQERNGRWHVYFNCCEVGSYGGGWPEKFSLQEAGVEAVSTSEPGSLSRQEVAWSEGGEWFPWTGATWYKDLGLCIKTNPESGAAGNIQSGTARGASEAGFTCN